VLISTLLPGYYEDDQIKDSKTAVHTGEKSSAYKALIRSLHLEGAAINGRVILKLSLREGVLWVYVAKIWSKLGSCEHGRQLNILDKQVP